MKKNILFIASVLLIPKFLQAQCPTASFTNPGVICANDSTPIVNTSAGASTYQWDFCGGDFSLPYRYAADDTSSVSNSPASMSLVNDGNNWYGFLFNYNTLTITRFDFGNSLDNTPTSFDLGNPGGVITGGVFFNDMSFTKEGNNWYGVFGIYNTTKIVTISFGPDLNNASPTTSVYLNSSGASGLCYQDMKVDNGNIYLFIAIDGSGHILRLNYGNSITNIPSSDIIDLSSNGFNELGDISLVKYCNHWYGFATSYSTNSIARLDFGSSLSNTPTAIDLGNLGGVLYRSWSIDVQYDGDQWYAFEINYNGAFNRIDFGKDLTNTSPTGTNLTYPGVHGIGTSVKVAKMNSAFYLFLCLTGNPQFSKVKYESPCSAVPQTSMQQNPVALFDSGGTYIISLAAADSAGNVNYFSDSVNVTYAPVTNFSFQNTCFNDVTSFQNLSFFQQGTITSRSWDFGDATTDGSINPFHTYTSPGKYVVTLSQSGSLGCNSTHTDTVIIGDVPVANFSATAGCSNIPVAFTDLSSVGFSNTIAHWHWDFGNGDTSTIQNPVYKYPVGGTYTVVLNVTSNYNCSATYQMSITINDAPKTGFTVANTCVGMPAVFTDTSTVNTGLINSWHWNFGDADTSITQSPSHSYPVSVATYDVSMIATSLNGCSDTAFLSVKINNVPVSSFAFAPATICQGNAVTFTDLSTVAGDTVYAWHWEFGDTDSSYAKNTSHIYTDSGTYHIVLTAYSQTSCSSSSTQTVNVVSSPTAGFTNTLTCLGDSTYFTDNTFTPTGTSITSRRWDFGDGDTSNLVNPVHHFDSAGTHAVTLLITDNIGCTNSFNTTVTVHRLPLAGFTGTIGCTSTPLRFFDGSISTDGTINAYTWNFGDPSSGSSNNSTDPGPSHIYYTAGVYTTSLLVTTAFGCTDTITHTVDVQQSSAANFQYLPTCEKQQMIFTNLDTIPSLDSLWSWNFGDAGVSFIESPSHYYFNPGSYNVTLSVTSKGGCVNNITKVIQVKPNPVANFINAPACINSPYDLQDSSHVASGSIKKWHWTFGNGDSSDVQLPQTTYTDTGDYFVTLRVISDTVSGCTNTVTKKIHVYSLPVPNFNYDPLFGSPPLLVNFNNMATNTNSYLWHFGDGDSSEISAPTHTFTDTGKFNITQIVYSNQGCVDSITKSIYVIKPELDIAVTAVSYQLSNNLFHVSAQIANLGTRDINNYRMQASIQDGVTIDEYVNTPLPSGAQGLTTYNFTAAFKISSDQSINYYCIRAVSPNGETDDNAANNEKCSTLTNDFTIVQPFPNPFTDRLQLQFILPYRGHVTVDMFDEIGKKISTPYDGDANAGGTTFDVSTETLASGLYFCRFTFRDQTLLYPIVKTTTKK